MFDARDIAAYRYALIQQKHVVSVLRAREKQVYCARQRALVRSARHRTVGNVQQAYSRRRRHAPPARY